MLAAVKKLVYGNRDTELDWFLKKNIQGRFTPDFWQLQQKQNHHVFVYDNVMKDHHKHVLIDEAPFLGVAFTLQAKYMMWKKDLGVESYPFVLEGVARSSRIVVEPSRIKGELYDLTPEQVIKLDGYMYNTVQFNRIRLKVLIPHFNRHGVNLVKEVGPAVEAWFYLGIKDYWEDLLDGGYQYPMVTHQETFKSFPTLGPSFHYRVRENVEITSKRTVS
jgi:hypothetical protein